jgi:hypothetical protein
MKAEVEVMHQKSRLPLELEETTVCPLASRKALV